MINKLIISVLLFSVSLCYAAANNTSITKNIEALTKEIRDLKLKKSKIDETRTDFKYFINLAVNNRPDLSSVKKILTSSTYQSLDKASQKKLKSVINDIDIKYKQFIDLLQQRKIIADKYLNIIEQITELEASNNREANTEKIQTERNKLSDIRKQLVLKEKALSKARLDLYQTCGISAKELEHPSTAAINQAQSYYIRAQKQYLNAELGISDDKASLNSAIGSPMY